MTPNILNPKSSSSRFCGPEDEAAGPDVTQGGEDQPEEIGHTSAHTLQTWQHLGSISVGSEKEGGKDDLQTRETTECQSVTERAKCSPKCSRAVGPASRKDILELVADLENTLRGRRLAPPEQFAGYQGRAETLRRQIQELGAELVEPAVGTAYSPTMPVVEMLTVPRDIPSVGSLDSNPNVIAAARPGWSLQPGEVVGVLALGALKDGQVLREAGVITYEPDRQ
jgi:hypothetical protein